MNAGERITEVKVRNKTVNWILQDGECATDSKDFATLVADGEMTNVTTDSNYTNPKTCSEKSTNNGKSAWTFTDNKCY